MKQFCKLDWQFLNKGSFSDSMVKDDVLIVDKGSSVGTWLSKLIRIEGRTEWLDFDCEYDGTIGIRIKYDDKYYIWNTVSSEWEETSLDYNTYSDFCDGFNSLSFNEFAIQFQLTGEDSYVEYFRLAYDRVANSGIDFIYSLKNIFEEMTVKSFVIYKFSSKSNKINLNSIDVMKTYDYDSSSLVVYDWEIFPDRSENLFDSFSSGIITLKEEMDVGSKVWIEFDTSFSYVVNPDPFLEQMDHLPVIHLVNIDSSKFSEYYSGDWMLVNSFPLEIKKVSVERGFLMLHCTAHNLTEMQSVKDALKNYFSNNRLLELDTSQILDLPSINFSTISPSAEKGNFVDMEFNLYFKNKVNIEEVVEYVSTLGELNFNFEEEE